MALTATEKQLLIRVGADISDLKAKMREVQVQIGGVETAGKKAQESFRRTADSARAKGRELRDLGQILSGTTALLSLAARGNKDLQDKLEKLTVAISAGSIAIRLYRNSLQLLGTKSTGVIGAVIAGMVLIAELMERLERQGKVPKARPAGFPQFMAELAQEPKRLADALEKAAASAARFTPAARARAHLDREHALSLEDIATGAELARKAIAAMDEKEIESARRAAEERKRKAEQQREEQRRLQADLLQIRTEAASALLEIQGRTFDAELLQISARFQQELAEAQGHEGKMLALRQRFWAQYAQLAKRTLDEIAQKARDTAASIQDIDLQILGVRREFFGITPREQIAALEEFKKGISAADTQTLVSVNRELLNLYQGQADTLKQQAEDLRARAGEALDPFQAATLQAKARELEETADRLRQALPAKAKQLGQEILDALMQKRGALIDQFNQMRGEYDRLIGTSASTTKAVGDQFTALGRHIVKTIAGAVGQAAKLIESLTGKKISVPAPQMPGPSTPPEFPAAPPAQPATLGPRPTGGVGRAVGFGRQVTVFAPGVVVETVPVPEDALEPVRRGVQAAGGALTSAVAIEKLLEQGAFDVVRRLEQFVKEGGGKGITVQVAGITVTLTADEEKLWQKFLERIAAASRRSP